VWSTPLVGVAPQGMMDSVCLCFGLVLPPSNSPRMPNLATQAEPSSAWAEEEYLIPQPEVLGVPYCVELAKSARSKCFGCSTRDHRVLLAQGALRFGTMDEQTGTYTYWKCSSCWRVPILVHRGLPDPATCQDETQFSKALERLNGVVLSGFTTLPEPEQATVLVKVMNKANWARRNNKPKRPDLRTLYDSEFYHANPYRTLDEEPPAPETLQPPATSSFPEDLREPDPVPSTVPQEELADLGSHSGQGLRWIPPPLPMPSAQTASGSPATTGERTVARTAPRRIMHKKKPSFQLAKAGVNGVQNGCLSQLRFVLTGTFPELGGRATLDQGKDKVEAMLVGLGAKVTKAVSAKTNVLVLGKQPGMGKFSAAHKHGTRMLDLKDLCARIESGTLRQTHQDRQLEVRSFSSGWQGNGLALRLKAGEDVFNLDASKPTPPSAAPRPRKKRRPADPTRRLTVPMVKSMTVKELQPALEARGLDSTFTHGHKSDLVMRLATYVEQHGGQAPQQAEEAQQPEQEQEPEAARKKARGEGGDEQGGAAAVVDLVT